MKANATSSILNTNLWPEFCLVQMKLKWTLKTKHRNSYELQTQVQNVYKRTAFDICKSMLIIINLLKINFAEKKLISGQPCTNFVYLDGWT